jgi:Mn-containing catalase
MFYHDKQLQYTVRVDNPNPAFARLLQQALGGVEGEIRVMMQYLFQAWNSRGPSKYRDMLLETGTEEIAHCEMLATAIAMNLEGAPSALRDTMASGNPLLGHVMSGGDPRQFLSGGFGALAADANGVPFNGSWVISSGNIVADMYSNAVAEMTGRTLATRLWEATDDPGMKDMLSFLIARDTMHQQQWLAVVEELGGYDGLPVPNSFPQSEEKSEFAYGFVSTSIEGLEPPQGRWTQGASLDGKGEFTILRATPYGQEPRLAPPRPEAHAQMEQMMGGLGAMTQRQTMAGDVLGSSGALSNAMSGDMPSGAMLGGGMSGSGMSDAGTMTDDTREGSSTHGSRMSSDTEAMEAEGAETIIVEPTETAETSTTPSKRSSRSKRS